MRYIVVNNISIEISDENADKLIKSGALLEQEPGSGYEDELLLDTKHNFTYEEVKILMLPND